jgi:hypothetical protein
MGSLSIWHILVLLFFVFLYVYPIWRIPNKAGYSGTWFIFLLIPGVNMVMLWIFASITWPVERRAEDNAKPAMFR